MRFSERIYAMQASPIRKLAPYGLEAKARGKKVYHLNIGQPDIKTPPSFFEAIRHFDEDVLAYGPSEGNPKLIEAIIEYYKDYHIDLEKGNILITAGASEAIVFAFTALCDPGDEILIPEPFYANYNPFAEWVSARIVPITTKAEEGFRLPPTETIEKKITPRTRAIVMCHPGNPTGMVYSREDMERIGHLALKHDFYIVADEVYREFVYDGLQYVSFGNLEDVEDRVLIMDSVSKRYSACGARIGCIVSKNKDLMGQIVKLCQSRTSAPTIDQVGAVALYGTSPSYLQEVNREYQKRRDIMYQALKCMPGVICEKPKGAFYMMVKLPVDDAEKFIIWMLKNFDGNGETVMAAPGEGFYATPGLGQDEVRLAYVLEEKELVRAMDVLKEGLEVYPGRIEAIKA
ncbi:MULTISPECIES: pyridoxal phosphate-dependent aminotransferase [Aminobacterium]|uniref:pyridoxal phosphate-dependent aminotransferase n=1 Tax=Aminobacterium TaxID=81466 RepID=UPI002580837C|nr:MULTISPECIES: pyridoxal phosphate-dependent aminotransferase [unclassified Aminobacterium]